VNLRKLDPPLPAPPDLLRQGPFRAGFFGSRLREERTAARIGRLLGIAFATCFVTGLISHYLQHPPGFVTLPSRPVWGYRLSQGLHVATGIASIPLLLAKLWAVYPNFYQWPPARSVTHALERLSLGVLVSGALFQVVTGLLNTTQWYPWSFFFTATHFWVAWATMGALLVHVAIKAPQIKAALAAPREVEREGDGRTVDVAEAGGGLSRRGVLLTLGGAVALVTAATVGQTLSPLSGLTLFAPRRPDIGPQGVPVNKTAQQAAVHKAATDPGWALAVKGPKPYALTRTELAALPQHEVALPITCVEGWSAEALWSGVRLRDLLDRAGIPADSKVTATSLEKTGLYTHSLIGTAHARDPDTLIALRVNGEDLHMDHGYPARLIAPNRPGVLQTKWLKSLEMAA